MNDLYIENTKAACHAIHCLDGTSTGTRLENFNLNQYRTNKKTMPATNSNAMRIADQESRSTASNERHITSRIQQAQSVRIIIVFIVRV